MIIRKSIALFCVIVLTLSPSFAQSSETTELQMSRQGDLELSCSGLSKEAVAMRDFIYNTQHIKDSSKMKSHGITAVGAVGSLLIGTATGGIGLAAAGFLMERGVSNISDDAEALQDVAQQRRSLMMGIYNAKGCYGPIEHAMQNPEPFDPLKNIPSIEPASGDVYETTLNNRYNQ